MKTMDRQQAHRLLDELGSAQFAAIAQLLEVMVHEDDDEGLTREERHAVTGSREYFHHNPEGGLSLEQMAGECGFTMCAPSSKKRT